jgi:hypothetical protein
MQALASFGVWLEEHPMSRVVGDITSIMESLHERGAEDIAIVGLGWGASAAIAMVQSQLVGQERAACDSENLRAVGSLPSQKIQHDIIGVGLHLQGDADVTETPVLLQRIALVGPWPGSIDELKKAVSEPSAWKACLDKPLFCVSIDFQNGAGIWNAGSIAASEKACSEPRLSHEDEEHIKNRMLSEGDEVFLAEFLGNCNLEEEPIAQQSMAALSGQQGEDRRCESCVSPGTGAQSLECQNVLPQRAPATADALAIAPLGFPSSAEANCTGGGLNSGNLKDLLLCGSPVSTCDDGDVNQNNCDNSKPAKDAFDMHLIQSPRWEEDSGSRMARVDARCDACTSSMKISTDQCGGWCSRAQKDVEPGLQSFSADVMEVDGVASLHNTETDIGSLFEVVVAGARPWALHEAEVAACGPEAAHTLLEVLKPFCKQLL